MVVKSVKFVLKMLRMLRCAEEDTNNGNKRNAFCKVATLTRRKANIRMDFSEDGRWVKRTQDSVQWWTWY
jgi:hypothetical protein